MKNYVCPKCAGLLNIEKEIIFLTKNKKGDSALVLLSTEIADYSFRKNEGVNFNAGDHVNFICPICYENLNAEEYDENLAQVIMIDEKGKESNIVFSKVLGEKCTYSIHDKGVEAFGDHQDTCIGKL